MTSKEARIQMGRALRNAVGSIMEDTEPLDKLEAGLTNGFEYQFCRDTFTTTTVSLRLKRTFNQSCYWNLCLTFYFWAHPCEAPRPLGCVPEAMTFADAAIAAAQAMGRIDDED